MASKLSGLPAGLGSQFSLSPGGRRQSRQSSKGEENTRGKREAVGTRKELGGEGKSGIEVGPCRGGRDGQHGFLGSFLLGFL